MELKDLKFDRLAPETIIKPFDCGDTDLNGFLFDDSKKHLKELIAVTYVLHLEDKTIAYYNLLNDKIAHTDLDKNLELFIQRIGQFISQDKRGKFKSYPAVKIGRLAVHKDFQGQKIGKKILDYLKANFIENNKTGCKFLTVDAYANSTKFYKQNGFEFLSGKDKKSDTRLMYFNLETLG